MSGSMRRCGSVWLTRTSNTLEMAGEPAPMWMQMGKSRRAASS